MLYTESFCSSECSPTSIEFVSAPCSSGKTYSATRYVRDRLSDENFMIVMPSLELLRQVHQELTSIGVWATQITSETHPGHVKRRLIEGIRELPDNGQVLLCTWNSYVDLPVMLSEKNLKIIIDEVPKADGFYGWKLPRHLELLEEMLELGPAINGNVAQLLPRDRNRMRKDLILARDDIDELFRPFKRELLSPFRDLFVDIESWERLVVQKRVAEADDDANRLYCLSMLNPTPFRNAILLGANVEDSILHPWLSRYHEVSWVQHSGIASQMREAPKVGHRLTIRHFIDGDRIASKHLLNSLCPGGSVADGMDRAALDLIGERKFLYIANNDRKSMIVDAHGGACRIPVISHGLNQYQDYDAIYYAAALNREPKHFTMLEALGVSRDVVHTATSCEAAYQAVMRSSLRDPSSSRPVLAIVPDQKSANWLANLTGANASTRIELNCLEKSTPFTQSERDRRHKAKRKLDTIIATKQLRNSFSSNNSSHYEEFMHEKLLDLTGKQTPPVFVTFHDLYAKSEDDHEVVSLTITEFCSLLKSHSSSVVRKKEDRKLFNPAVFEPAADSDGWRTKGNFKSASFLLLDFDGGALSPEEFIRIFRKDAGYGRKLCFLIYNSYSRSKADPNRFHVVVFLRRNAASVDEFRAVYDLIVDRLEENGITKSAAGLDNFSGVQSFYLPATNPLNTGMAFFTKHGVNAKELRHTLDPAALCRTAIAQPSRPERASRKRSYSNDEIDAMVRPLKSLSSGRNRPIFDAARGLMIKLGVEERHAETLLLDVVGSDPSARKKVRDATKSVSRWMQRGRA